MSHNYKFSHSLHRSHLRSRLNDTFLADIFPSSPIFSTAIVSDASVDRNLCCVGDDFCVTSEKENFWQRASLLISQKTFCHSHNFTTWKFIHFVVDIWEGKDRRKNLHRSGRLKFTHSSIFKKYSRNYFVMWKMWINFCARRKKFSLSFLSLFTVKIFHTPKFALSECDSREPLNRKKSLANINTKRGWFLSNLCLSRSLILAVLLFFAFLHPLAVADSKLQRYINSFSFFLVLLLREGNFSLLFLHSWWVFIIFVVGSPSEDFFFENKFY